jgi:chromate transport protein ChrA
VGVNQTDADAEAGNPNWLADRFAFEWPWLRAIVLLLATCVIIMQAWSSSLMGAMVSAGCALLCCLAIGFKIGRKSLAKAIMILLGGAFAGLLLPHAATQAFWLFAAALLGLLVVALRWFFPYRARLVRVGDSYSIAGTTYKLDNIKIRTPRVFYLHQDLLEQLIELARYADAFLSRHGMAYVLCYGTLLGAIRHKGPMPWDDDVDFTVYRPQDIRKLQESFAELAAAASRDGFCLTAHNDYWKLSKKGFWRFPVVDFYRAAIYQPLEKVPQRMAWGGLQLSVADNAVDHLLDYYGKDVLTEVVFDIPYWDSGFVPAAATRLFGLGFTNLVSDAYQKLFGK